MNKKTVSIESTYSPEGAIYDLIDIRTEGVQISKNLIVAGYNETKYPNDNLLLESAGFIVNSVKLYIKKVKDWIVKLFRSVARTFDKYFISFDSYVKRYKNEIQASDPNFKISTYDYTFDKNIPKLSIATDLIHAYNTEINDLHYLTKGDLTESILRKAQSGHMDSLRGSMMGMNEKLFEEELLGTMKRSVRSGAEFPTEKQITKIEYLEYVNSYKGFKETFDKFKKEKDDVLKLLSSIENFFKQGANDVIKNGTRSIAARNITLNDKNNGYLRDATSEEFQLNEKAKLDLFFSSKWEECQTVTSMLTMALSAKYEAMNESLKTYKHVIYTGVGSKKGVNIHD